MSKSIKNPSSRKTKTATLCSPLLTRHLENIQKNKWIVFGEQKIDLSKDVITETLNDKEQYFIKMILAFFAASDGIVLENLGQRFMNEVQIAEARCVWISNYDGKYSRNL